jgi:probable rRNA maturation factor
MLVIIENEYEGADFEEILNFDYQKTAEVVVSRVLSVCSCPFDAEVNILLTGLSEIEEINSDMRGIASPTDVLSFPMHEYAVPADFAEIDPDSFDYFDPDSGLLLLGDIVLCIPRIKSQAEEYCHSTMREYAFLIAHSILHLIGYDHMTEDEAEVMFKKQDEVLSELGITRE